ncbi:MAG: ATP-binding protein [Bryobacteraceae bacterium]
MPGLPINIDDLIKGTVCEDVRREFKGTWDDKTKIAVAKTISAFANDLPNLNGGYVVLGIDDEGGRPVLPPRGLNEANLERIQKEIRGECNRIDPVYQPIVESYDYQGKPILVLFAPAGETPPYEAPKGQGSNERARYVRTNSETVEAKGEVLRQLVEKTARTPFDDRRNNQSRVEDISSTLVRKYLHDVRSDLLEHHDDDREIYRRLQLVSPVNAHEVPRNVALLFFTENPDRFFRGAKIEIVQFADELGGDLIEEKVITGPLPSQIHAALNYLSSLSQTMIRKVARRAEVDRSVSYPYEAMEEALVNALYHRSYDESSVEPTKIRMFPDRMEIVSYPGPVPGVTKEGLAAERGQLPPPARNRRIGEFLKALRLAEAHGTGIPKIRRRMRENGSPSPSFDFDEARTSFRATLPAHPQYLVLQALRESSRLWATGERRQAIEHLKAAVGGQRNSGALVGQLIEYGFASGDKTLAMQAFEEFVKEPVKNEGAIPYLRAAAGLLNLREDKEAQKILRQIPVGGTAEDLLDEAILRKRSRDFVGANRLFENAKAAGENDPKFLHEFAQTKMEIAGDLHRRRDFGNRKQMLSQAAELLRRTIDLSTDDTRKAWAYVDLGKTLQWLKEPVTAIEQAYLQAKTLRPFDADIQRAYERWAEASQDRTVKRTPTTPSS